MKYTFSVNNKKVVVSAKDPDRARVAAKLLCGKDWTSKAKLIGVSNKV